MAGPRRIAPDTLIFDRRDDSTDLRPRATPSDNFFRGPQPEKTIPDGDHLAELSQSLAQLNPKLDRFATQKIDEMSIADQKAAEVAAMTSSASTLQEAIDKGEIQPGQSPLYQRVFAETVGKREGITTAPMTMYQAWNDPANPDRTSTDPAVIGSFFAKQRDKMLEGKSEEYKAGFLPSVIATQQQLTQKVVAEGAAEVQEKNEGALGQLYFDRIMANRGKMNPAQISALIAEDTLPQQFAGLKGSRANAIQAQAIIAAAKTSGNSGLLKVGYEDRPDLKNPGQSIPGVFKTPKYAMAADDAATSILSKQNAESSRALMAEARAEKAQAKSFLPELLKYRRDHPDDQNIPDALMDKAAALNIPPTAVQANWAASKKLTPVDPADKVRAMAAIAEVAKTGGDVTQVLLAHPNVLSDDKQFTLLSAGTLKEALNSDMYNVQQKTLANTLDTFVKKYDPVVGAKMVGDMQSELSSRVLDTYLDMAKHGAVDPKKLSDATRDIGLDIQQRAITKMNPEAPTTAPKTGTAAAATPAVNPNKVSDVVANTINPGSANPWASSRGVNNLGTEIDTWTPPASVAPPDAADINIIRTSPFKADGKSGKPAWQIFDEIYGPGATDYFTKHDPRQIELTLRGWKQGAERAKPAPSAPPTNPNVQ